ncbi:MAG: hypothetical protein ACKVQS_07675 [Fimbriimonadaceae bacterium]
MAPSILLAISIGQLQTESPAGAFSETEADRLVSYWNQPERMKSEDVNPSQPYQPVYSPIASAWLYNFYKKRDPNQPLIPTKPVVARTARHKEWDATIDQQYSQDYAWAQSVAAWMNAGIASNQTEGPVSRPLSPIPADLQTTAGTPPPFFLVNRPQKITINLESYFGIFEEGVEVPRKYPFLRSAIGTVSSSTPPNDYELNTLAAAANLPKNLIKPLAAVARLEGGFDTINTYDTGGISMGIIQFASLMTGRGSLSTLLQTYKNRQPSEYAANFRRYGIDIAFDGRLTVIDPRTGFENSGADAVRVVVEDKRLTAVFQRAAKLSSNFRAAQVRLLGDSYNPAKLSIPVTLGSITTSVQISNFINSEAGLATLMDRLVNRGTIDPLPAVVSNLARENNITTISGLASLEKLVIERMTYRHDFLAVSNLGQPSDTRVDEITGSPNGKPTTLGAIGSSKVANNTSNDAQVAPFDPTQAGKVSSPSAPKTTSKLPAEPAVSREPTPSKPAGPITIAGG